MQNFKRRIISISAALMTAVSMQAGAIQASAEEKLTDDQIIKSYGSQNWTSADTVYDAVTEPIMFQNGVIKNDLNDFQTIIDKFSKEHSCNYVDPDASGVDAYDFAFLENYINDLLIRLNRTYKGIVYVGETAYKLGAVTQDDLAALNEPFNANYDIDMDGVLSPDDYCYLLRYIQEDFDFSVHVDYNDEDHMTASITKYNPKSVKKHVVVPYEVITKGRIFPVMKIENYAFANNNDIESVCMPDYRQPKWNHDEIHNPNYKDNIIPTAGLVTASTYMKIGNGAFSNCSNLSHVELPQHAIMNSITTFAQTAFQTNCTDIRNSDGVLYQIDSVGAKIAIGLMNDKKDEVKRTHKLVLDQDTTAINKSLMYSFGEDDLYEIEFPETVEFIQPGTFEMCTKLSKINNLTFAESSETLKKTVRRYLSAFGKTQYLADATQSVLDVYVDEILNSDPVVADNEDLDKVVKVARKITDVSEYSNFYSINWNKEHQHTIDKEFKLYLNRSFYTNDYDRESNGSASAVFMLGDEQNPGYAECGSFSFAASLMLDQMGIQNYLCGAPYHALNVVYVDGMWHRFDETGLVGWNSKDINEINVFGDVPREPGKPSADGVKDEWADEKAMWVSGSSQFKLYEHSKDKQMTVDGYQKMIYGTMDSNMQKQYMNKTGRYVNYPAYLHILFDGDLNEEEQRVLSNSHTLCDFKKN